MTLRRSLLMVEQNHHNDLMILFNSLSRNRSHNSNFAKEMTEVAARIKDSEQRIKELS